MSANLIYDGGHSRYIKPRTDLGAAEIQEEGVSAEYPTSGGFQHAVELFFRNLRLKYSKRIQKSHTWNHGTPRAENDQPGTCTAFGVFVGLMVDIKVFLFWSVY